MTLMYDRLDHGRFKRFTSDHPADRAALAPFLDGTAPAFEITNVAQLAERMKDVDRSTARWHLTSDAYPNFHPPYRHYWMEFRIPPQAEIWHDRFGKVGIWCVENDETTLGFALWLGEKRPWPVLLWQVHHDEEGNLVGDVTDPTWVGDPADTFKRLRRQRERPVHSNADPLLREIEAEAAAILDARERAAFLRGKYARTVAEVERHEKEVARIQGEVLALDAEFLKFLVLPPVLLAHSLLGCKNVATEDHAPVAKVAKARAKRTGHGLVIFKTLAITPTGGARQQSERVDIGEGQTALHLVRGHFKTFTPERPLFGTRVGTYWWSPMVRGNETAGVIVKDYEMKASA